MVTLLDANRFCKKWMPLSLGDFFSTNQVFRFRVLGSTFKFGPGIPNCSSATILNQGIFWNLRLWRYCDRWSWIWGKRN